MNAKLTHIVWPAIAGLLAALLILDRWVLPSQQPATNSSSAIASYSPAVSKATPSVVNIYTAKLVDAKPATATSNFLSPRSTERPRRRNIERALGSGVIMTQQGHILTNSHVIRDADAIAVMLHDGRSASAKVIGSDSATDLAVLKIDLPDLQPIELGDSDTARVGDVVLAIGNPLGFGHSVSQGIVSALGRYGLQQSAYEDYIQTDATILLGNSGGALIDVNGKLLGINTMIYTSTNGARANPAGIGIGLATPVNLAVFVMQDLIDYGEVIRGWLGVSVEPVGKRSVTGTMMQLLMVASVAPGGPGQRAGIQPGDIVTHIDGEEVHDGRLTALQIARLRPGDKISIAVQRGQQSLELRAIVGVLNQSQAVGAGIQ